MEKLQRNIEIKKLKSYGKTLTAIGKQYGISRQAVYEICKKKTEDKFKGFFKDFNSNMAIYDDLDYMVSLFANEGSDFHKHNTVSLKKEIIKNCIQNMIIRQLSL